MILLIILLVFGILQIILFFKVWGMTNDINKIRHLFERLMQKNSTNNGMFNRETKNTNQKKIDISKGSWGKDVTEEEKVMAKGLISKLMDDEVILLIKGKLVVYDACSLSELNDYKVIYYK